jgi:hypothetical protein
LNAAQLRLEIASIQLTLGDRSGASAEICAALAASKELESKRLMTRCQQLELELR